MSRREMGVRARFRAWIVAFGLLGGSLAGLIAPPAAPAVPSAPGTPIDNVADGAAYDSLTGTPLTTRSNAVRALVQPLEALTLVTDRRASLAPGTAVVLSHRITNAGNITSAFRFDLLNLPGDGFDLVGLAITLDRNGNGVVDAGDAPLPPGASLVLAPGAAAELLVDAAAPPTAPLFAEALLRLSATGLTQGAVASNTDTLHVAAPATPPALAFFLDDRYAAITHVTSAGAPLYLQADATACDLRPAVRDTLTLTLASQLAGDAETVRAIETAPSSGRFRVEPAVPTLVVGPGLSATASGVLETVLNDQVTATLYGCGAVRTEAQVWVDPAGTLFDSRTNLPVAGARIALLDASGAGNGGNPGGPARVYQDDGVTPAPSELVTDAAGRYRFPWVAPGSYRLDVGPPASHRFPSARAPQALPPGHLIDGAGSYGRDFPIGGAGAPVRLDVPLDARSTAVLFVEKAAARAFAEIGDQVDYVVRVANRSDSAFGAVTVHDSLPAGFALVVGTARRDSARLDDPPDAGPALRFALGPLPPNATATLRYRVRVGPGAYDGDGVNRVYAEGGGVFSNVATARVTLTSGVFAQEASVLGTVYVDHDGDRRRGPGDPGLPGVRVYVDDGTFAITDAEGQFSFYGLSPRTHALKVDETTLPRGAQLVPLDHRHGDSPGLRFLDLQRGDLQRADFAAAGDSAVLAAAAARRGAARALGDELERGFSRDLSIADSPEKPGDPRARPTSGLVVQEGRLPLYDAAAPVARLAAVPAQPESSARAVALDRLAPALEAGLGFIGPRDRDTLLSSQATVQVKGTFGLPFELRVNGELVPVARVGRRTQVADRGVEVWEYVGVRLAPGPNRLEVLQRGPAGGEHGHAAITVVAPDRLGQIELSVPRAVPADGHSEALVRVRALDASGVPVAARVLLTLEATLGQWGSADLDPATPGLQVAVEAGEAVVGLVAPGVPGVARVRALSAGASAERAVNFVPELRPLLVAGTLEGVLSLKRGTRAASAVGNPVTGFEQQFSRFVSERADGKAGAAARGALFAKGRIREDVLLTVGYDSDRPAGLRRFRDMQPDAFYPIYGDASVRGYEAQSTGSLYARLDHHGASLLYGDFITQGSGGSRTLSSYSRSLTGVQEHYEDRRVRLDAFASREHATGRVDEIPGRGVSGPYQLSAPPIVENSERVEILVRDRSQPGVILGSSLRSRFTDYELDPLTGRLLFKAAVPSLDADLNPVSIRVSYEIERGGQAYWVSGATGSVKLGEGIEVGGLYVDDHEVSQPYELRSAFAGLRLGAKTTLEAEYAASHLPAGRSGDGGRLELRHEGDRAQGRVYGAITDSGFVNPTAGFGPGRAEGGARFTVRVAERSRLVAEGLYSGDVAGDERLGGMLVALDQGLDQSLRGELGLRLAGQKGRAGSAAPTTVALRGKLLAQLPRLPALSGYAEYEQDLREVSRRMAAVGGEYRFAMRGRVYARNELISSLGSVWALSESQRRFASVLGVDADVAREAHVFSEYRLPDALGGRDAEAAVGLRNTWPLDVYRANTSFEMVKPIQGADTGPVTALTGAIETVAESNVKASARVEVRTSRGSDSFLSTLAAAVRMDSAWSALGRTVLDLNDARANGTAARARLQLGVAYRRPEIDVWDVLARYELHYDRDVDLPLARRQRLAHVVSLHTTGNAFDLVKTSLSWAAKYSDERADGVSTGSGAQWFHGRLARDLGACWDAGVNASVLLGHGPESRRHGLGVEVGRALQAGAWLSAGWNRFGYRDDDLPDEAWTEAGVYLRLRAKFDETILRSGGPR